PTTRITIVDNDRSDIKEVTDLKDVIDNIATEEEAADVTDQLDGDIDFIRENMPEDASVPPSDELVNAINTTIENTGQIIRISNDELKAGRLTLPQALKTLALLDDAIDLGAGVSKADGKVSIQKVAGSIKFVEDLMVEAIAKGATTEQIKESSGRIDKMLDNMPDMIRTDLKTVDVVELLEPLKNLTGAGIKSAVKGGNTPAKTVDSLGSVVSNGLRDAIDAGKTGIVSNTGRIIESASKIVNNSVYVLRANTDVQTVIEETLAQLQKELSTMLEQTTENIRNKSVISNIYTTNERSAVKADTSPSMKEFAELMKNVSGLTTNMIKSKSVLSTDLSGEMQTLSNETMKNILPGFISNTTKSTLRSDSNSDIQNLLDKYPQFLNEVIQIASVDLTSGMLITSEYISRVLENNSSLTSQEKERLINGLPELPAFDQDIVKSGTTALSLEELLTKELQVLLKEMPGISVEVKSVGGIPLMVAIKGLSPGLQLPLYIQDARVVSSGIPTGFYLLPEGTIIFVSNGIAGTITPAPLDAVNTLLSADELLKAKNIDNLFSSGISNISDANIDNSGNFNLAFNDGSRFSGAFDYVAAKEGDGNFDAGTSSFELHGTDPATEAYSVLVVYEDGSTQQLSPSVSAIEQLVMALDTLAAGSYAIDKATGILTVLGMRFKPSYLIEPIVNTSDKDWFKVNKDIYGLVWETMDYNDDGVIDLKMWTSDGRQVIYTVAQ
ncbi:MAG: hypothetical protein HQK61_09810, partial [Desulfamplus sp.]|nr:hypothetical protein [Desulfamplus sp.]